MGYRDDFYVRENIIGITGRVHDLPSVYFRKGNEYGHITQIHAFHWNWGRTPVLADAGWSITNLCPSSCNCREIVSHEINGDGQVIHRSRTHFKSRDMLTADQQNVCAEAIHRCPFMKTDPYYDLTLSPDKQDEKREQLQHTSTAMWTARHTPLPGGRRGAINYTGEGLANQLLGIAYPHRL